MIVSFNEMHRFCYKFQAFLSANVCYCFKTDQTPSPFISLFIFKVYAALFYLSLVSTTPAVLVAAAGVVDTGGNLTPV